MGNSSTSFLPVYSCFDSNLSRNSVTPQYWDTYSISEDFRITSRIYAIVTLLFFIIGLPSNIVIIVSIIKQKLYRSTTNILLLNLAVSDLLFCLLVIPFITITGFAGSFIFGGSDYTRCQLCQFGVVLPILSVFSVNIICFISVDRFIFIKFPLRYEMWVTKSRAVIIIAFLWLLAFAEGILPVFGIREMRFSYRVLTCALNLGDEAQKHVIANIEYGILLASLQVIPISVTIIANIWIACIARVQIGKVYRIRRSFVNQEDLTEHNRTLRRKINRKKNKVQLVLVRVFGGIVAVTFIAWTPIILLVLTVAIADSESVPLGYYCISYLFYLMHPVLHSLIEGCFIPEIKATFIKVTGISLYYKLLTKGENATITLKAAKWQAHHFGRLCCDACSTPRFLDIATVLINYYLLGDYYVFITFEVLRQHMQCFGESYDPSGWETRFVNQCSGCVLLGDWELLWHSILSYVDSRYWYHENHESHQDQLTWSLSTVITIFRNALLGMWRSHCITIPQTYTQAEMQLQTPMHTCQYQPQHIIIGNKINA